MSVITFLNKKTQIPNWVDTLHESQPRSYAYKKDGFCISIYGKNNGLYNISTGLAASQHSASNIEDWVTINNGAESIEELNNDFGEVINSVWRPSLYFQTDIRQALSVNDHERLSAEQSLYLLIQKLYDLFLYIEPSTQGQMSYGHKTRELLILACTEVENAWQKYMKVAGETRARLTTNDYVKLLQPLHLKEYEVTLKSYSSVTPRKPFLNWVAANPTSSLAWYDAYNKTKHDRENHFYEATLETCIDAVAANIILFCVRYGPYSLYESQSVTSSYFNQLFEVTLSNPDPKTFYIPNITFRDRRHEYVCGDCKNDIEPWIIKPLTLN